MVPSHRLNHSPSRNPTTLVRPPEESAREEPWAVASRTPTTSRKGLSVCTVSRPNFCAGTACSTRFKAYAPPQTSQRPPPRGWKRLNSHIKGYMNVRKSRNLIQRFERARERRLCDRIDTTLSDVSNSTDRSPR